MKEDESLLLPPYNIPYRLKVLALLNDRRITALLEPYQLTPMQYGVLCCLWREDGITTTEISETLRALGGTLTVVLDGLESRDLAVRRKDIVDKRLSRIFLTEKARNLEAVIVPAVVNLQNKMFAFLTREEVSILSSILDKLLLVPYTE